MGLHRFSLGICIILTLASCSPIRTQHGFNANDRLVAAAQKHTLSKREVLMRFGPASFSEQIEDGEMAYYVSYTKERFAFFKPDVTERTVTALNFKNGILVDMKQYGLEDGHIIDINTRKTPNYGKDLNAIQQILSNVGRFNSVAGQGRNDGSVLGRIPGGL